MYFSLNIGYFTSLSVKNRVGRGWGGGVPPDVTRSTDIWGTQRSPELVFRGMDFGVPENLTFLVLIMMCLKEKVWWWNSISLKKDKGCVIIQVKDLIKIIVKVRADKILYTFVSCTKHLFEGHKIINVHEGNFAILWKGTNWKFIFPWRVISCHILKISEGSF